MKVKAYTLNSFAKSIEGGNPAGVVLDADDLSERDMKKIAEIIGFSETAFVLKSEKADFRVRFFTPNEEVDLCGHATIATFHVLASQAFLGPGRYSQETKAGVLEVEVREGTSIMMAQNLPVFSEIIGKEEIATSLHITSGEMPDDLPVQIVSTGLRDIFVPVRTLKILNSISPDFEKVTEISRKYDTIGYHVFTLESLHGSSAHCRNFAPLYGIPEESATGTSNGALACYLFKYGKLRTDPESPITIEQGYSMGKPSEIVVCLETRAGGVSGVKVGGKALNLSEIEVEI